MRISDWSSDVCSSDLVAAFSERGVAVVEELLRPAERGGGGGLRDRAGVRRRLRLELAHRLDDPRRTARITDAPAGHSIGLRTAVHRQDAVGERSEEHTSELQSLMRSSYAVSCLKKKKITPIFYKSDN